MRRIADLHAGEAKLMLVAAIIAEACPYPPHALRTLKLADEQIAELSMLCGLMMILPHGQHWANNRIRGLPDPDTSRHWSAFSVET